MVWEQIHFMLMGLIGAMLYVLVWSESWEDLKSYSTFRHLAVGALSGLVFYTIHSKYNVPNSLVCIVFGYFGPDIIEALFGRLRRIIES